MMRKADFSIGLREIVIATIAVIVLILITLIFIGIINPAVESGNVFSRRALG